MTILNDQFNLVTMTVRVKAPINMQDTEGYRLASEVRQTLQDVIDEVGEGLHKDHPVLALEVSF